MTEQQKGKLTVHTKGTGWRNNTLHRSVCLSRQPTWPNLSPAYIQKRTLNFPWSSTQGEQVLTTQVSLELTFRTKI
jgi:hypothetical protein